MNRNLLRASLLGTVSLFALTGGAQALTISDSDNFNIFTNTTTLGGNTGSDTVTLDEFDPSSGTLSDITFVLESDAYVSGTLFGQGNGNLAVTGNIDGTLEMDVTFLSGSPQLTLSTLADSGACSDPGPGGGLTCEDWLYDSTNFDDTLSGIASGDFGLFTGVGTFDVNLDSLFTLACGEGPGDTCSFTSGSLDWYGSVTVVYTYDLITPPPTDVPEPGTLALFGVGLLGMTALRRRRRDGTPPNDAEI